MGLVLALYGAQHFKILLGLREQVDKMRALNGQFKSGNAELSVEVSRLRKGHEELSAVNSQLKQTTKAHEANIAKFKALDEKLASLGKGSVEGLEKLQEMSATVQDSIRKELVQHERDILNRVQDAMEFGDDQEGLNEDEYNRMVNALPKSFRSRFDSMGKSFSEMAGDDGVLDMDEFTKVADAFAEEIVDQRMDS